MAVILNLREFGSFPAHKILEGNPEKFSLDFEGVLEIRKQQVRLAIQESGEEYYCQGDVEATVRLRCSRCLTKFDANLSTTVDFIVCSEGLHAHHRDQALDDEDYAYFSGSDRDV
ncbi:MAG: hypothetical protein U9R56_06985, partial [candidate division Zixibacteria bacterium]|nr:hypothetical protein [candidate division Zixibacteria bacterium]